VRKGETWATNRFNSAGTRTSVQNQWRMGERYTWSKSALLPGADMVLGVIHQYRIERFFGPTKDEHSLAKRVVGDALNWIFGGALAGLVLFMLLGRFAF